MNNWMDRLMQNVADLRTQLIEEEHKLCDWHGTVLGDSKELKAKMNRKMGVWIVDSVGGWRKCFLKKKIYENMFTWKAGW